MKSENIQISIPDWNDTCDSCNIILSISKLLSLVVYFLIPGAVSEPFASWQKDRSYPSSLNHAVVFVPTKDLWRLPRFDQALVKPTISSENFLITQIKMFCQSLWWKLNSFTFNSSFLQVPWQYRNASPSGGGCIVNRLKIHFSRNYFLPSLHLHIQTIL